MSRQLRRVVAVVGILLSVGLMLVRARVFGKGLGEAAFKADECRSGRILSHEGGGRLSIGGICTKECAGDDACGTGFRCYDGNCAPAASKTLGQPCDSPWECSGRACIGVTSPLAAMLAPAANAAPEPVPTVCSQKCSDGSPCPSGYDCIPGDGEESYCLSAEAAPSVADILQKVQSVETKP